MARFIFIRSAAGKRAINLDLVCSVLQDEATGSLSITFAGDRELLLTAEEAEKFVKSFFPAEPKASVSHPVAVQDFAVGGEQSWMR